jgi:hypothetical protein
LHISRLSRSDLRQQCLNSARTVAAQRRAPSSGSTQNQERNSYATPYIHARGGTARDGDVTLTPPGNSSNGFASQRWIADAAGPMITFQNVKTGLYLRMRNGGPIMHQTVTTGSSFTIWLMF